MGKYYNTSTANDKLIFYLDAANIRCYGGNGLTASSLVGGLGVTLVNGTGYSTENNGFFVFDGINDYIPFSIAGLASTITIEMWANIKRFDGGMPFGFGFYALWTSLGHFGFNTNFSDVYGLTSSQVVGLGLSSNWKSYHFVMNSSIGYTYNKIYVNSDIQSLSQARGTGENPNNRNFASGVGKISGRGSGTAFTAFMDVAIFKIYNKELSQNEINKNYNAMKGRFGL